MFVARKRRALCEASKSRNRSGELGTGLNKRTFEMGRAPASAGVPSCSDHAGAQFRRIGGGRSLICETVVLIWRSTDDWLVPGAGMPLDVQSSPFRPWCQTSEGLGRARRRYTDRLCCRNRVESLPLVNMALSAVVSWLFHHDSSSSTVCSSSPCPFSALLWRALLLTIAAFDVALQTWICRTMAVRTPPASYPYERICSERLNHRQDTLF